MRLLNLGCGDATHPDWVNADLRPNSPEIAVVDVSQPLPFVDASFSAVYIGHLVEHLPRGAVPGFLAESHRILAPGGVLRVVTPDLETLARLYLDRLGRCLAGDKRAVDEYDWITLELFDQATRETPGGDMLALWQRSPLPGHDFIRERIGSELDKFLAAKEAGLAPEPKRPPRFGQENEDELLEIGRFRRSGEVHFWLYDRFSLGRLMVGAGFASVVACRHNHSAIADFSSYHLDDTPDGDARKPDSMYLEGIKPPA